MQSQTGEQILQLFLIDKSRVEKKYSFCTMDFNSACANAVTLKKLKT